MFQFLDTAVTNASDAYLSDSSASDNIPLAELKQLLCEKKCVQQEYSSDDDITLAQSCFYSDFESGGSEYQFTKSDEKKFEKGVSTSELSSTDKEQLNVRQKKHKKRKHKGHDGPGIAHLRVIALMPFFFFNSSRRHFNDFTQYKSPNW